MNIGLWVSLTVCVLSLLGVFYTSGLGCAFRCGVILGLCPRELRAVWLACLAAKAQEEGNTLASEMLEEAAQMRLKDAQLMSVRIELQSQTSMGFSLLGAARDEWVEPNEPPAQ